MFIIVPNHLNTQPRNHLVSESTDLFAHSEWRNPSSAYQTGRLRLINNAFIHSFDKLCETWIKSNCKFMTTRVNAFSTIHIAKDNNAHIHLFRLFITVYFKLFGRTYSESFHLTQKLCISFWQIGNKLFACTHLYNTCLEFWFLERYYVLELHNYISDEKPNQMNM